MRSPTMRLCAMCYEWPHLLAFELRLDGDRLTGVTRAESSLGRPFFGLPFYTALERKPTP